jgi:hypothetical protein
VEASLEMNCPLSLETYFYENKMKIANSLLLIAFLSADV